ncbi:unnamed protein product, partial [Rhizoctonia solani]
MDVPNSSDPILRQWEETGEPLAVILAKYLKLSTFLETASLGTTAGKVQDDLVARIDWSLEVLYKTLYQQLKQTRATPAETRNRLVCSIFRVPEEILCEIFMDVIFTPAGNNWHQHLKISKRVRIIYQRLYSLFGVCAKWRDICLARPIFWSLVPMCDSFDSLWRPLSVELSFQRSGVQDLNLLVDTDVISFNRMEALNGITTHFARTRTLNIRSGMFPGLRQIFGLVMEHRAPEHVSQLSLCFVPEDHHAYIAKDNEQHLFKPPPP